MNGLVLVRVALYIQSLIFEEEWERGTIFIFNSTISAAHDCDTW